MPLCLGQKILDWERLVAGSLGGPDLLMGIKIQEDVGAPGVQVDGHQCLVGCSEVLDALCTGGASEFTLQICTPSKDRQRLATHFPTAHCDHLHVAMKAALCTKNCSELALQIHQLQPLQEMSFLFLFEHWCLPQRRGGSRTLRPPACCIESSPLQKKPLGSCTTDTSAANISGNKLPVWAPVLVAKERQQNLQS